MSAIPFIELRDLNRTYGRMFALHRVNLRLDAGAVHVVLGPNGAGKSTLLNILATLERPSSGVVRFGERWGFREMERGGRGMIGVVSHESLVYNELTAVENLRFFARLYDVKHPARRVDELLDQVALEPEAAQRPVRTYSRGMRQRLSIARGLLNDPALWILDEPFTGLDRGGREIVHRVLETAREEGRLVVISTHALETPASVADQIIVLKRGRVKFAGPGEGTLGDTYSKVIQ